MGVRTEVQNLQRLALMGMTERHSGHFFSLGSPGGGGWLGKAFFEFILDLVVETDSEEHGEGDEDESEEVVDEGADVDGDGSGFLSGEKGGVGGVGGAGAGEDPEEVGEVLPSEELPDGGMMMWLTRDLVTVVKAAPTVKPIARSMRFPRRVNFLKSARDLHR